MMTDTHRPTPDHTNHRLRDGYEAVVDQATHAYDRTVESTGKVIDRASDAARRATSGIESNPIALLVGGIAFGALVGALVPRSAREKELLAPLGARISGTARAAVSAAKEAGRNELEARGLTKDAARDQAKGLLDGVLKAATAAAK